MDEKNRTRGRHGNQISWLAWNPNKGDEKKKIECLMTTGEKTSCSISQQNWTFHSGQKDFRAPWLQI